MDKLYQHHISINTEKSNFCATTIKYLGFRLKSGTITIAKEYLDKIIHFPRPTTLKAFQRLIGMVQWITRFYPHAAEVLKKLQVVTKKNYKSFNWDPTIDTALQQLKYNIINNLQILQLPQLQKEFHLFTDSSKDTISNVLMQMDESGVLKPVYFSSKTLDERQQNWAIGDKEL